MTIQEEIDNLKKEKARLEADKKVLEEKHKLENEIAYLNHKARMQKIKKRLGIFRVWGIVFRFCWGVCWKIIKGIFVWLQQATQNYQATMEKKARELEGKKK